MKHRFFIGAVCLLVLMTLWSGSFNPARAQPSHEYLSSLIQNRARVCGIQFDDGHFSHYTIGVPILQQYGLIGSFGIVTGNTDVNPNAMTTA